jgi:hypothetical protein
MNPSTLIFLGLAVVWAVVLLPEVIRKLSGARSSDSIRSFNQQLSVLHRSDNRRGSELPGAVRGLQGSRSNVIDLRNRAGAPMQRNTAAPAPRPVSTAVRKRRQEVLTVLGASVVLSLVLTVAFGGVLFLGLLLVAGVLLVAYVAALAQLNQAPRAAAPLTMHNALSQNGPSLSDGLRTATVGRATPAPRRIAN